MDMSWNPGKAAYDFTFTERELGIILFALTATKLSTKDPEVAAIEKDIFNFILRDKRGE